MKTQPARPGLLMSFSLLWQSSEMDRFYHFFCCSNQRHPVPEGPHWACKSLSTHIQVHMLCICFFVMNEKKPTKMAHVCQQSFGTLIIAQAHINLELYNKSTCVSEDFHTHTSLIHTHIHTRTIRSPWKEGQDLRRPNQVWQSTALLKQAPLQPNTAVIVNVRQN